MASRKFQFAQEFQIQISQLSNARYALAELGEIYEDEGYGNGDPITDNDIAALEFTAAELAAGITFVTNLIKFMTNVDPTNQPYDEWLSHIRTVP